MSLGLPINEDVNADLSSMNFRYDVPGTFLGGVALLLMYLEGGVGSGISFKEQSAARITGCSKVFIASLSIPRAGSSLMIDEYTGASLTWISFVEIVSFAVNLSACKNPSLPSSKEGLDSELPEEDAEDVSMIPESGLS